MHTGKPGQLLYRPRLGARADASLHNRLTILCAPAGFGKSVALSTYLDVRNIAHATYHVQPADASIAAIARGIADALSATIPGLRASYASAIEYALQARKPHAEVALWFQRHVQDMQHTIVLEDAHHATATEEGIALLETLIECAPQIRWIVSTRSVANLPVERWRAEGLAGEPIGIEELRLNKAEAYEIAASREFPSELVETLYEETQGWPLAFRIGTELPDAIPELAHARLRSAEDAYAFLIQRLLDSYDRDLRDLLLGASVIGTIDRDTLTRLGGASMWERLLEIARGGLLLSVQDDALRMHDLFRDFLETRLRSQDTWQAAAANGAAVLEDCGRIPEALRLFAKANSSSDVLRLCELHGFDLIEQGRADDLHAAIRVVPEAEQNQSAVVLALRGITESLRRRADIAQSWFLHALERASSPPVRAEIAYRYALELVHREHTAAIDVLEPYARSEGLPLSKTALIRCALATAYVLAGRFHDGRGMIEEALAVLPAGTEGPLQAKIQQHAAWVALFTGAIDDAKRYAGIAIEQAQRYGMYDVAARAYSVVYNIVYDIEDDPKTSAEILNAVLDCGLKGGNPQVRLFALFGMVDICAEMGEHDEMQRIHRMLESYELDYSHPAVSETLLAADALMRAGRGEFGEAYQVLVVSGERQITPDRRALRFSEIALYAGAARMRGSAESAIKEVLDALPQLDPNARRTVRTRLNAALTLQLLGERLHALEILSATPATSSKRLEAFRSAVLAIFERWEGSRNHTQLADALDALRAEYFGGLADVLAALPRIPQVALAVGMRSRWT
jgi:ATP/maltotriose-dependent transcriptional regulator MalT